MMKRILFCLLFFTGCSVQNNYGVVLENDIIGHTDKNYSHGTIIKRVSVPEKRSKILQYIAGHLPAFRLYDSDPDELSFIKTDVGQEIHTPADLKNPNPILDDNPYAGYLYGKIYRINATKNLMLETSLESGMIGPSSFAEEVQKFVHNDLGRGKDPRGWDNQLRDEPILNFNHSRTRQWDLNEYIHQVSESRIRLGNLYTDFRFSNGFKFGYNIPNLDKSDSSVLSIYTFLLGNLDFVAHNIFYDGNTWKDSQSVDTEHIVGGVDYGVAAGYKGYNLMFKVTTSTKQFSEQSDEISTYGGLIFGFDW